jgi:folate-binding protein YgfZ
MPSATSHNDSAVSPIAQWPAHFSTVKDEFTALRSTAGVFHAASRAKIRLTGSDRVRWLNGMITNNIRDLAPGHGVYSFLLNPQGHILGDLYAYHCGDSLLVDTDQAQRAKILATFDHYIIMDDVEVADITASLTTIGLVGPSSTQVLATAGVTVPNLQPLQFTELSLSDGAFTLIRGPRTDYPSFEIWLAPERAERAINLLKASGASLVGSQAVELYRVARGLPRYAQDIRERDLPQETEQSQALNFNKGCYVGQEIVERIRSRGNVHRKFVGFRTSTPPPAPGAKIQAQGKEVGEVTSAATIPGPHGEQAVALGYIRRELSGPGKEVQIDGLYATVSDLPFAELLTR